MAQDTAPTSCVIDIDPHSCNLTPQIFLSKKQADNERSYSTLLYSTQLLYSTSLLREHGLRK